MSVWASPAVHAPESERAEFLRKVGALTFAGLTSSAVAAVASAAAISVTPALWSRPAVLLVVFGCWGLVNFVFRGVVNNGASTAAKIAGFFGGAVTQGVALGYMLLIAVQSATGAGMHPLTIVGQAMAITFLVAVGMLGWLLTGPKDLSLVRGGLAMAALPMLAMMVIGAVFPIGGVAGLIVSGLFVVISTAGLLYQLNLVMHSLPTSRWVEGSYTVTLGLLVLFWNLLALLSRRR